MYHNYIYALCVYMHTVHTGRLVKKYLELKYLNQNATPKELASQFLHSEDMFFSMRADT